MTSALSTRTEGGILEVTLDRPKANAINLTTSREMGEIFAGFRDDPALRVAIVKTAGDKFFSAGWDLKAAADGDAVDGDYGQGGFAGLQELRDLNKPVIACVQGMAVADYLEKAAPLIDEARKSGGSVRYMDCRHVLGGCECYHPDYFPLSRNTGNAIEHGEFNCRTACLACRKCDETSAENFAHVGFAGPANDRCIEESAGKFVQQLKDPEHECGLENPAMCEIHRCNMFGTLHCLIFQLP